MLQTMSLENKAEITPLAQKLNVRAILEQYLKPETIRTLPIPSLVGDPYETEIRRCQATKRTSTPQAPQE